MVRLSASLSFAVLLAACARGGGGRPPPPTDSGPQRDGTVSDGGMGGEDSGGRDSGGGGCATPTDCEDGIACTVDTCASGTCGNTPDDSLCAPTQTCVPAEGGCVTPPPCIADADCDDGLFCTGVESCDTTVGCRSGMPPPCDDAVACTTDTCDATTDACRSTGTDADGDGRIAAGCLTGDDCNDGSAAVYPGAPELCDGLDNDCAGGVDAPGLMCALGSPPMACTTPCATSGTRACDASCTYGPCRAATETCSNSCDDDGDGMIDEGCMAPPPVNDQCSGAILLAGSATRTTDTLVGATAQTTDCGSGVEIFYRVAVSQNSLVYLDTFGSAFDTRISYRGTSCPGAASGSCVDDSCATLQTQLGRALSAGTHYFAVHTFSSATTPGPITLRHQILTGASGDNTLIAAPGTFLGTTSGVGILTATCPSSGPEDSFFWLQCPGVSRTVTATTCDASTAYDTALHLQGPTGVLACNDDDLSCTWSSLYSRISGSASGAGLFVVFADGYGGSSGTYRMTLTW